jgi:hypothetical protein
VKATSSQMEAAGEVGDAPLSTLGFTAGAAILLSTSVDRFSTAAIDRAVKLADMEKQGSFSREVTTSHVKIAVDQLSGPLNKVLKPNWYFGAIATEYILTLIAGAGAGHLDKTLGVAALLGCGLIAILVMSIRHIYVERDR